MKPRTLLRLITLLCTTLSLDTSGVHAGDFSDYDFQLRFPAALSHFSPYGEVAAKGGAGAASPWSTSINPASLSFSFTDCPFLNVDSDHALSSQFNTFTFDQGQEIYFLSEAAIIDLKDAGVLRLSFANGWSNEAVISGLPVTFDYALTGGRVDWGLKLNDSLHLGLGAAYSQADVTFRAPAIHIGGIDVPGFQIPAVNIPPFDAIALTREFWSVRTGLLYRPAPRWMFGLNGEYGRGRNDTISQLPTQEGFVRARVKETIHQGYLRIGMGYALDKGSQTGGEKDKEEKGGKSWLLLDYEWSRFAGEEQTLDNHRVLLGADYMILPMLHVRAGTIVDGRGNAGVSAGLGLHLSKHLHIDTAWQRNVFPELDEEFGQADTLNLSIAYHW